MSAQEQKVVQPYNKPSLERIYRDLSDWYPQLTIETTPFGICMALWYTHWQKLHPASTPEYREMMQDMSDMIFSAAKDVEQLVVINEAMAKKLESAGIDVDEIIQISMQAKAG